MITRDPSSRREDTLTDREIRRISSIAKALSDETRLRILKMLEVRPLCVCEIQHVLKGSQPNVSHHLKTLSEAGLVEKHDFLYGPPNYEVTFGKPHHDHLMCIHCGEIIEFQEPRWEVLQDQVAKRFGYQLLTHTHKLYGLCRTCQRLPAAQRKLFVGEGLGNFLVRVAFGDVQDDFLFLFAEQRGQRAGRAGIFVGGLRGYMAQQGMDAGSVIAAARQFDQQAAQGGAVIDEQPHQPGMLGQCHGLLQCRQRFAVQIR